LNFPTLILVINTTCHDYNGFEMAIHKHVYYYLYFLLRIFFFDSNYVLAPSWMFTTKLTNYDISYAWCPIFGFNWIRSTPHQWKYAHLLVTFHNSRCIFSCKSYDDFLLIVLFYIMSLICVCRNKYISQGITLK